MRLLLTLVFTFLSTYMYPATELAQIAEPKVLKKTTKSKSKQRSNPLDLSRKGVVMINVKSYVNATDSDSKRWKGTGFIVDKSRGLIATNHLVAGNFSVCSYELKFSNGLKVTARRRYVDPFLDFAILEVDPKNIPEDCDELKLSEQPPQINDEITTMGNSAGDEFSTKTGTIFNIFDCVTPFNDQSFHYSGITVDGASGSPVFNKKGEVVGIIYGGKFVSGTVLPIRYVKDALTYIKDNQNPPRKSIGLSLQYIPIDELLAAGFLTEGFAKKYRKEFPDAKGKIITVQNVISGFKGAKVFEPGDILVEVNNQPIGPHMIDLGRVIDTASEPLKFKILRDDKEIEVTVVAEDLMQDSENKMISFMGTVWFEHHDQLTVSIGNRDGGVYFAGISKTSPLRSDDSNIGKGWDDKMYKLVEIDGKPVESLKELEERIPSIEKKSMFTLRYIDYIGQNNGLTAFKQVDRNPREILVRYEKAFDTPKTYTWDATSHNWKDQTIAAAENNSSD
ncbi:MAG: S1C family serine protease [Alphaproteobacteria bacterium]